MSLGAAAVSVHVERCSDLDEGGQQLLIHLCASGVSSEDGECAL